MKKVLTLILIFALCLTLVVGLVACNKDCKEHVDENGDYVCDNCEESLPNNNEQNGDDDSNSNAGDNGEDNEDNDITVEAVPKAEYTSEKVGDVTYVYYGTLPLSAVTQENNLHSVLVNLIESSQLTPNASGYYVHNDKEYACIRGTEDNEGIRLSNGLTMEEDKLYVFNVEKIKWRVLEEKEGRSVLLCENIIAEHHFNPAGSYSVNLGTLIGTPNNANDYSVSSLRTYVNETLLNEIFTVREKQSIFDTNVILRPGESAFMLTQGMYATTVNKMYIPSYWEINEKYDLKQGESKVPVAEVPDYQLASGFNASTNGTRYYASWWLRTSGEHINEGNIVNYDGTIGTDSSCSVNLSETIGIRPMITLRTA